MWLATAVERDEHDNCEKRGDERQQTKHGAPKYAKAADLNVLHREDQGPVPEGNEGQHDNRL